MTPFPVAEFSSLPPTLTGVAGRGDGGKPWLLDWYCCEGGAAAGYHQAGWEVVGVDHKPQPRYPFRFVQANALDLPDWFIGLFDAHHASPPCQFGTELNSDKARHLNLIPQTRARLKATGKPYTIENVRAVACHLINPVSLFGTMFDMHMVTSAGQRFDLSRERCFETNWPLVPPCPFPALHPIANVFGGHLRARSGPYRTGGNTGRTVDFPGEDRPALARKLMEMPWATMKGMSEAVPPPFTEYLGAELLAARFPHLSNRNAALGSGHAPALACRAAAPSRTVRP